MHSLAAVLLAHVSQAEQAARPFLIAPETGHTQSYAQLAQATLDLAQFLQSQGIAPGSHIGFLLPNGLQATSTFIGSMAAGYVSVPLSLLATAPLLRGVLQHSGVRLVFTDSANERLLRDAALDLAVQIVVIDPQALRPLAASECTVNLKQLADTQQASDTALLMYTSGTTGTPKGALLSHRNLLHTAQTVSEWHSLAPSDRVLSSLPLYHINGQCIATLAPFYSGGSIVAPQNFSNSQWWSWVERYQPTWLNMVPTIIAYLLNGKDPVSPPSSVRFGRSASAPLPPAQQTAFEARFGFPIIEGMGMTECASMVFCNPAHGLRKIGSPGKPCGVEAKVINPAGESLIAQQNGELCLRGDNVMQAYYQAPEQSAQAFTADGWLRTGDIGHFDADGFYFITGRIKELIIKGGENIAPREIDEALLSHPAVLEAAAFALPHASYGEEIAAAIVWKPDATPVSLDALREHAQTVLGKYKTPSQLFVLESLPKGPSGKVQRLKLPQLLAPN
jgi:acyl-CoA synthetase (AMP-forming)/AMP-acid ligase II